MKAQVATDQALYNRAVDQKRAGVAAGIDVLRAQVQLKIRSRRCWRSRTSWTRISWRSGGLSDLHPLKSFKSLTWPFSPLRGITQEEAQRTALAERPDYQSSKKLVEAAQQTLAAARAEWYPTVDVNGYYGDTGPTLGNSHGVFSVTGALNFNIYTGGRIRADVEKARAALKQRSDELADLGAQVEVDVRDGFSIFNPRRTRWRSHGTTWFWRIKPWNS